MHTMLRSVVILIFWCLTSSTYASELEQLQQHWADTVITTKIKTQFTKNKNLNPLKISVKTEDGVVSLKGHAKNKETFVQALRIVIHTKGVHSVDTTAFEVKSVNSAFKDAYITAKIEAAVLESKVFDDDSIPLVGINASTSNGMVTLSGTVKHQRSIAIILKRAQRVRGVKKIRMHLKVADKG